MKNKGERGWDSPSCTWPRCRYRFLEGGGDGNQVVIDGVEHRLCSDHNSKYMNGETP